MEQNWRQQLVISISRSLNFALITSLRSELRKILRLITRCVVVVFVYFFLFLIILIMSMFLFETITSRVKLALRTHLHLLCRTERSKASSESPQLKKAGCQAVQGTYKHLHHLHTHLCVYLSWRDTESKNIINSSTSKSAHTELTVPIHFPYLQQKNRTQAPAHVAGGV